MHLFVRRGYSAFSCRIGQNGSPFGYVLPQDTTTQATITHVQGNRWEKEVVYTDRSGYTVCFIDMMYL